MGCDNGTVYTRELVRMVIDRDVCLLCLIQMSKLEQSCNLSVLMSNSFSPPEVVDKTGIKHYYTTRKAFHVRNSLGFVAITEHKIMLATTRCYTFNL